MQGGWADKLAEREREEEEEEGLSWLMGPGVSEARALGTVMAAGGMCEGREKGMQSQQGLV